MDPQLPVPITVETLASTNTNMYSPKPTLDGGSSNAHQTKTLHDSNAPSPNYNHRSKGAAKQGGNAAPKSPYASSSSSSSTLFSVNCVAVCVSTILIMLAVAVVLAVSVTYSLRAADDFAESYSRSNLVAAVSKINDYVTVPVKAFTEIKKTAEFGYINQIPTNATGLYRTNADLDVARLGEYTNWLNHFNPIQFAADFQLLYVAVGLEDQSWIACNVDNVDTYAHSCTFMNPLNQTHYGSIPLPDPNYKLDIKWLRSDSTPTITGWYVANTSYNPTARPWYSSAPRARHASPVFSNVYIDAWFSVPIVDVNGPFHDIDGNFLGVTSISLDLRHIATFLASIPRTANALTALVDGQGYLLGTSEKGAVSTTGGYYANIDPTLAPGCESHSYNWIDWNYTCRFTPKQYANPTLRSLAHSYEALFAADGLTLTTSVTIGGDKWVFSKAPIAAKTEMTTAAITWQVFTLMPVNDVNGPIVDGRNVGIIIAVVMVVISCVGCGLALFALLHPLSSLANLIESASELSDDSLGTTVRKSRMREIRTIQDAYERLSQQLRRAKSFLPASILAQLESTSDDDEDDGYDDGRHHRLFRRGMDADDDQYDTGYDDHSRVVAMSRNGGGGQTSGSEHTSISNNNNGGKKRSGLKVNATTDSMSHRSAVVMGGARNIAAANGKTITNSVSLANRTATVACLNLRDFHRAASVNSHAVESSYGRLLDVYHMIAKEHRGILDSFHGDRFTFTFNALRPCGPHAALAASAMLKIVGLHQQQQQQQDGSGVGANRQQLGSIGVSCGIATGRCLVGNLGSERAKRFTVIGPAFSQATILERLCKRYPFSSSSEAVGGATAVTEFNSTDDDIAAKPARTNVKTLTTVVPSSSSPAVASNPRNTLVLMTHETALECETQISLVLVDVITTVTGKTAPIAAAIRVRGNGGGNGFGKGADEWMYQLNQASMTCDYHKGNVAFRAALSGAEGEGDKMAAAKAALAEIIDDSPQSLWAKARVEEMVQRGGVKPVSMGHYFDECVLPSAGSTSNNLPLSSSTVGNPIGFEAPPEVQASSPVVRGGEVENTFPQAVISVDH